MATFTVSNLNDSGTGSLREAISAANAAGGNSTVTFDPSLKGGTLMLTSGELDITAGGIKIDGEIDGTDITIDANGTSRVFKIDDGNPASTIQTTLNGLVIENGYSGTAGGGGIYVGGSDILKLSNSTLTHNLATASDGGGIYAAANADISLDDVTLWGNAASVTNSGGGIFGNSAVIGLTNCTLSGNSAAFGGGIATRGPSYVSLTNTTVSGNSASQLGGGVFDSAAGTYTTLTNSIIAGNRALAVGDLLGGLSGNFSSITFYGGNLIGSAPVGFASASGAPPLQINGASSTDLERVFASVGYNTYTSVLSGVLANNGGPVETIALTASTTNPAIDAGNDSLTRVPTTDARGFTRSDFPGVANNGASIADLGAFEVSHQIVVTTLDDVVDPNDGLTSLREALTLANETPGADTITFAANLAGGTLMLSQSQGELFISDAVTIEGDINGDGTPDITVDGQGQRIFGVGAAATLDGLVLTDGHADFGGAVRVYSSGATISHSIISNSSASFVGGGIYVEHAGGLTLDDDAITGNSSHRGGGVGEAINGASVSLTNVTLTGNSATQGVGGGIYANGSASLTNVSVTGNSASSSGGGIFNANGLTLTNSIVAGNSAPSGDDLAGSTTFHGGNIVGDTLSVDGTTSRTGIGIADIFASVGNNSSTGVLSGLSATNGTGVPTVALAATYFNPAIDGSNASAPAADARGYSRVDIRGVGNDGSSFADLGAYEVQSVPTPSTLVVTTLDDESYDGGSVATETADGNGLSLREALGIANAAGGNITIDFDPSLGGGTLTLDQGLGLLKITTDGITIDGDINGDGAPDITISGGNKTAVLFTAINGNINATLDGLVIENGYASPTTGFGGGIFVGDHDSLTLTNSIIADNSAADGGGIFVSNQASLAMADSTVSDNAAVTAGGGIFGYSGATLALTNVTVSGNSAAKGGGIIGTANDQITLADSTITGNKTTVAGGGGLYSSGASAVTTVTNSIVAGNSSASAGDDLDGHSGAKLVFTGGNILGSTPVNFGSIDKTSGSYTPINGTSQSDLRSVFAQVGNNPTTGVLSGLPAANGAGIQTVALNATGIAIDAGVTADLPPGTETDERGFSRMVGSSVDIGAFEQQAAQTFVVTTLNDELDSTNPNATLADEDGGTGLSLREALFLANEDPTSADTITFDPSLAGGTLTLTMGQLGVTGNVTINGDIYGNGTPGIAIDGNNTSRVFDIDDGNAATSVTATLNGLIIQDARANGYREGSYGGGIYVGADDALTLSNSAVTGNYATAEGGGLYAAAGASLALSNDLIEGNRTNGNGGGIYARAAASLALTGSYVYLNSVNPEGGRGGGIFGAASTTLSNSTLTRNYAAAGGGIYGGDDASLSLVNSGVYDNSAMAGGGVFGGANTSINLTDTTLAYNSAETGGGVFGDTGAALTLVNATLAGNYARDNGGGLYGYANNPVTLTNSTLTGNGAGATGGGIYNQSGSTTLVNSIVAGNYAAVSGSDLGSASSSLTLTGGNIIGSAPSSFTVTGSYTPIDGTSRTDLQKVFANVGYTYVGFPQQMPVLSGQLGNNAGGVDTVALNPTGIAIDTGVTADAVYGSPSVPIPTDARGAGFYRVVGASVDLGAFEQQAGQSFVVTTLTDELDSTNPSATLADMDGGTGLSLREALFLANEDPTTADTITFDPSLANGTIDLVLGQLKIDGSVTIEGGNDDITIDAGGSSRVFDAVAGTSTIDALTMTGGYSNHGGAVSVGTTSTYTPADLTISNSTITGNQATYGGGLAVNYGASLELTNTTVSGNTAYLVGGAIANQGTLTLTNSTVENNSSGYIGGGIASDNTLTVIGSTLSGNQVSGVGGGLFPPGYTNGGGGGLYNSGSAALLDTTIAGNKSGYAGGGIYNSEQLTLTNVTLADNSAYNGGGLANAACGCGNVSIYDTTITGNDATQFGGGIYNANGAVTLANSIVAGNGAGYQDPDIAGTGTTNYTGVNLFSQAGVGRAGTDVYVSPPDLSQVFASLTTIDPDRVPNSGDEFQAGTLANNGGPVETVLITQNGAAQDDGENAVVPSGLTDDARGDPRVFDGIVDLGAVELQVPETPVVTPVAPNINASASETLTPSQLFSISAPVGFLVLTYELEDESTGSDSGFWVLNGAVLPNGQLTTLTAAQLSQLSFVTGSASAPVTDTLEVAASDSAGFGALASFKVTAAAHASTTAPTVTAANELKAPGLTLAASGLFSGTAFGNNTITSYEVVDNTTDSGHWVFNGVVEPTNQLVLVTAAQLAQLTFATGYGTDNLMVRANDGSQWGSFASFTVTPPPNGAPPAGTEDTLVMLRNADGAYEFYDIGQNKILLDGPLGQINPALQVAGVGGFNGADTADLLMRDPATGAFTLYDVSNNNITGNVPLGQVGPEWTVAGVGDFSTRFGETDMLMRNSNTGAFEVYDIANNTIMSAQPMGQVGLEWQIAGFGDFSSRANETDMLMRNSNTGAFEVYDIANNTITSAQPMGQVGLEWQIAGFGDFSTRPGETDMLLRNSNNGAFEVYDIVNNAITSAQPMGQVGLEWTIAGFGDFSGNANETDMLMRNSNTGVFTLFDISNNTVTGTAPMGQVGLEWSISGVSASVAGAPPNSATAQLTQAMASFAPTGATSAGSPLNQPMGPAPISTTLLTTNHA